MLLTIPYLSHCLSRFSPTFAQQGKPDVTISSVELFVSGQTYCDSTLYIGKNDIFPAEFPVNLVFIGCGLPPKAARTEDCNLIILPPETDLASLLLMMCQVMLSGDVTERFAAELLGSLSNSDRLKVLAEIGYRYFGNPIIISDKNWRAIAMAPDLDLEDDSDWMFFRRTGMLSIDAVTSDLKADLGGAIGSSLAPFYWKNERMDHPRLYISVTIAKRPVATISILEYNKPFAEHDYALLPLMSAAVSAEMQKTNNLSYARGFEYEELISDLLDGRITSPVIINSKLRRLNLRLKKCLYLYVVDMSAFNSGNLSLAFIRDYIEKLMGDSRALVYQNNIVLLHSCAAMEREEASEAIAAFEGFLKEHGASCGVSYCFYQLTDIRIAYRQAMEAIAIGKYMKGPGPLYWYRSWSLYHIAKICSEKENLLAMCQPKLLMLMDYDREHNTSFTDSLYAYFLHSRNITQSANALNLHRNTMIYHLKKIEEIMGVSLSAPDFMLHLELSFRFLQYDYKYPFQPPGTTET